MRNDRATRSIGGSRIAAGAVQSHLPSPGHWPYPADDADDPRCTHGSARHPASSGDFPAEEQQRICNGWRGDPTDRPTRREMEALEVELSSRTPAIVLSIQGDRKDLSAYQQMGIFRLRSAG